MSGSLQGPWCSQALGAVTGTPQDATRIASDSLAAGGGQPLAVWRFISPLRGCDVPISQNLPLKGSGHLQVNFDLYLFRMQVPPFLQGFGLHCWDAVNVENTEQPCQRAEHYTATHMPRGNYGELPPSLLALNSHEIL